MEKKRLAGVTTIGVFETLFGLIGCLFLGAIIVDIIQRNGQIGFGWLSVPFISAWTFMLPLGVVMFLQNRLAWLAHIILWPSIVLVIFIKYPWYAMNFGARIMESIPLALCVLILYYLTRPAVREQFR